MQHDFCLEQPPTLGCHHTRKPPLNGGGGPTAPPSPPPAPAQPRADAGEAKKGVDVASKRRIGGDDSQTGGILALLKKQGGAFTNTLGGPAAAYTGEE